MEELIRQIIERQIPITIDVAKVVKLKGDVCHVESLSNEKDFFNCRINAIEVNGDNHLKVTPKVGSTVVIGIFKDTEKAVILSVSEAETVNYQIGDTVAQVDAEGFKIERQGENLKQVLNEYIDEVNKIKVIYGNTINVAATTAIKSRLNQILK